VGLAVARGCDTTKQILITDQLPMLALMQKNIVLNHLGSKVTALVYDWGTPVPTNIPQTFEANQAQWHPDVIFAADCVYFEPAFPLLLRTLSDLLGPETVCYFCFKKRRKADWRFIKQMQKQFNAKPVPYKGREEDQRKSIYLFEVRRR
jgi:protein N-lysine methyltransferase METTL21A